MIPAIRQDQAYHLFADGRALLGIANAADTLSNAAFLVAGTLGLIFLWREFASGKSRHFVLPGEMLPYWLLFCAVALTAFGSAYYHLAPDDTRLTWDRLPMSLGFTALLAATVSERIHPTWGAKLLLPLVLGGAGSVAYWRWSATENLLPYVLAQYGSIAAILAIVIKLRSRYTHGAYIFGVLALYAAAKAAEALDAPIYAFGHFVSGHSLKHVLAALAAWWLLRMLKLREPQ
jgi:hypothetical protein